MNYTSPPSRLSQLPPVNSPLSSLHLGLPIVVLGEMQDFAERMVIRPAEARQVRPSCEGLLEAGDVDLGILADVLEDGEPAPAKEDDEKVQALIAHRALRILFEFCSNRLMSAYMGVWGPIAEAAGLATEAFSGGSELPQFLRRTTKSTTITSIDHKCQILTAHARRDREDVSQYQRPLRPLSCPLSICLRHVHEQQTRVVLPEVLRLHLQIDGGLRR